jgi:GAF domain-containing protein
MGAERQVHLQDAPKVSPAGVATATTRSQLDFQLLCEIAGRIATANLKEMFAELIDLVASLAHCDSCFIYLVEGDELVLHAAKNPHAGVLDRVHLKNVGSSEHEICVCLPQDRIAEQRMKAFNGASWDSFQSFLSVPLMSRNKLLGYINLQCKEAHKYLQNELDLLAAIGLLAGAEIEILRLREENSQLSSRLESRKVVEQAKGILQERLSISEKEAYVLLQKQSQQIRKPMKEIAEAIILSHSVKLFGS